MNTTRIHEIWKQLKFVSDVAGLSEEGLRIIGPTLENEIKAREIRRMKHLLHRSGIRRIKRLEDFDWKFNPKVPRAEIMALAATAWEKDIKNAVFIGPSGVGKTHLGEGLCVKAIERGIPATSITCYELVDKLRQSRNKPALMNYYSTVKLLCLDELGYVFPSSENANDIFQIVSRRSEIASTIVTTNLLPANWGKIFEAATATAILDRLSLNGTFFTWEGRSYRSKK
jgi:DNA replication protein DnaC